MIRHGSNKYWCLCTRHGQTYARGDVNIVHVDLLQYIRLSLEMRSCDDMIVYCRYRILGGYMLIAIGTVSSISRTLGHNLINRGEK